MADAQVVNAATAARQERNALECVSFSLRADQAPGEAKGDLPATDIMSVDPVTATVTPDPMTGHPVETAMAGTPIIRPAIIPPVTELD